MLLVVREPYSLVAINIIPGERQEVARLPCILVLLWEPRIEYVALAGAISYPPPTAVLHAKGTSGEMSIDSLVREQFPRFWVKIKVVKGNPRAITGKTTVQEFMKRFN